MTTQELITIHEKLAKEYRALYQKVKGRPFRGFVPSWGLPTAILALKMMLEKESKK